MEQFRKPEFLNGEQLIVELKIAGVSVNESPILDENSVLWLDIKSADKSKAAEIVESHIGVDIDKGRAVAKSALLDRLGISADEATLLLS